MTHFFSRFLTEDDGVTSIEYALIAVGIAVAVVAAVNTLGQTVLNNQFNTVKDALIN